MLSTGTSNGKIKVLLKYHTWEPKHIQSHILATEFKAKAPFVEEVAIWISPSNIGEKPEIYLEAFDSLMAASVVPAKSQIFDFAIIEENRNTLAYHWEKDV
jgi:hypothetical protein